MLRRSPDRKTPSPLVTYLGGGFIAALVLVVTGASLFGAELYVRQRYVPPELRARGAEAFWRGYGIQFPNVGGEDVSRYCSWQDSLAGHPYVGWVNTKLPPCGGLTTNNVGMPDPREIPYERDPDYYSVMLLGGSVASQMIAGSVNWLEKALNERFVSPSGKPFRVLSGAMGAWSFPAQLNYFTMFGDAADAVVALDGYNELKPDYQAITRPSSHLFLYVTRPALLGWRYRWLLSIQKVRAYVLASPRLRRSFFLFLLMRKVADFANADVNQNAFDLLDRYFEFPADWSTARRDAWNRNKYGSYIRQLKEMADAEGLRYAHFVQPIPNIGKKLTAEEAPLVNKHFDPDRYKYVIDGASAELRGKGYHTFSLLHVFDDEKRTVYSDEIHYLWDGRPDRNLGYEIVSGAMAEDIGKAWRLRRRPTPGHGG